MEETIKFLADNYQQDINSLEVQDKLEQIDRNDPEVLKILSEQYRPTDLAVGTVGAYLWGGNQNYYGDVSKNCSGLSVGSLQDDDSQSCQYSIWTYIKELKNISNISNFKAYIYVSEDWLGFTKEDIEILKKYGVSFASILTTEFSKHKFLIPMTSIDDLPIVQEVEEKKAKSNNIWIFVLIFLMVAIYFILQKFEHLWFEGIF